VSPELQSDCMLAPKRSKLPDTTNCATDCLQISDKYAENMTNLRQICIKYDKYARKYDNFAENMHKICVIGMEYVQNMKQICKKYVIYIEKMHLICKTYARNMQEI
jgi:hypothetical protein